MTKTRKIVAVLLCVVVLSGVTAVRAMATPDEWITDRGRYLNTAGKNTNVTENRQAAEGYLVRKGDTLLAIAARFGVSAADLASVNSLRDSNLIREGQLIMVPGIRGVHMVAQGENLSIIALKNGVSIKEISEANGLKDEDFLMAGQRLVIPGKQRSGGALMSAPAARALPVGEMEWPVVGWISSPFGMREGKHHDGVDIAADQGTPVKAVMSGRVVFAGPRGSYGLAVILDHGDGLCTLYAHHSKILVTEGEWVNKGQVIALVGNTGRSMGPHLHMEMLINGVPYDPMLCFNRARA
ncbi:MAG: peptidoglycan DD-metalloendopeptidase family protein [Bacillota bacterium]